MSKIRIDGHEVEADDSVLRKLLFGMNGSAQRDEIVEKKEFLEPDLNFNKASRVCLFCKKSFIPKYWNSLLCSNECRKKRDLERVKIYEQKSGIIGSEKVCVVCKNPIPKFRRKTCSIECLKERNKISNRKYHRKNREMLNQKVREQRLAKGLTKMKREEYNKILSKRFKFLTSRGSVLAKTLGISYEEGKRRANMEWEANKHKWLHAKKPVVIEAFPKFSGISPLGIQVLEGLFKHAIANNGKVGYFEVKNNVQRLNNEEWNALLWHELVKEVVVRSEEILSYFGAKGKIKHFLGMNGYDYLQIEGGNHEQG